MDAEQYHSIDEAEDAMWWYRALHARLIEALAGVNGSVLHAGCGSGGLLAAIGRARPDLVRTGVEFAATAAGRAFGKSSAEIVRGSVNALPFADASFDAAVAADVLCHAAVSPPSALAELHRVLRPNGKLILNMPAYAWLASAKDRRAHNARRVTPATLRIWLTLSGFTDIHMHFWNGLLLPLMVLQRRILPRAKAASDVAVFPPWLDSTMHKISRFERRLPFALPAGGSVLATATRPASELPS